MSARKARKPATTPAQAEQRHISALLASKVNDLRIVRGLSWERLSGNSGLALHNLRSLREDLVDPRLNMILRLCRGLGVDVAELLGDLPLPVEPRDNTLTPRRPRRRAAAKIVRAA